MIQWLVNQLGNKAFSTNASWTTSYLREKNKFDQYTKSAVLKLNYEKMPNPLENKY